MKIDNLKKIFALLKQQLVHGSDDLNNALSKAHQNNSWFIPEFSKYSLNHILENYLEDEGLDQLLKPYNRNLSVNKSVGIVMAGNIPMVGFHDLLMVLMTGNKALVKMSSKDRELMLFIIDQLRKIDPVIAGSIEIVENLKKADAYIATGSNNSGRYFEYYFGKKPNIIRKNRNSVAVLTGNETSKDLDSLADDVFMYFGLGCRNVSKLLVPKGFDVNELLRAFNKYEFFKDHSKYRNNYDYQKAIMLMESTGFNDNGFVMALENKQVGSPVAVLHYELYSHIKDVNSILERDRESIQCIVSALDLIAAQVAFGQAQTPQLNDFADNVNTVEFLIGLV